MRYCWTAIVALLFAAGAVAWAGESPADLQFHYAEGLFRDGLRKLAVPELEKFIQTYPQEPRVSRAHYYLAECRRLAEDLKGALPAYEAAAKDAALPERPLAVYRVGDCRFRLGDTKGSIEPLREFLGLQLASPEHQRVVVHASYALARAELAERHFDLALVLFQRVLDDNSPENTYKPYVLLPMGDCLAALNRPAEALGHYQKLEAHLNAVLTQKPDPPDAQSLRNVLEHVRMKVANLHLGQKQHAEALDAFQKVSDQGPFAEEVVYGRAQALFFLGRHKDALGPALDYLKRFPSGKLKVGALYIAAEAQYRSDSFPEAERLFGEFLAADAEGKHPARETAAYGRLAAAYRQGQPHAKEIAAAADFFLQHYPESKYLADVHYFRAEAAFWLAQYDAALAYYQKVPAKSPYEEEVTHQAAVCLDLLQRAKDAGLAYDVYLDRYPQGAHHRTALERTARLWGLLKDYGRAAERYGAFVTQYGKAAPDVAEDFLYRKGACEYEAKQYDAMHRTFSSYFEQYPGGKHKHDVLYFLAWYYDEQKKQPAAAAPLYKLCVEIAGPHQNVARLRLAHAYASVSQARRAENKPAEADDFALKGATLFLEIARATPDQITRPNEYLWTAETLRKVGRKPEAIEAYERLVARFPDQATPVAVYWLGELARTLEPPEVARAEKYFTQFLQQFPKHEYTLSVTFGLAETLRANAASPNHAKAAEHYRTVLGLAPLKLPDPQEREALVLRCQLQLGRIAFDAKQFEEASEQLRRVGYLAAGEEAAEALYKAGVALHQLKDTKSALAIWQRLLRQHGESAWAKRLAQELPPLGLQAAPDGTISEKKADAPPPAKS